MDVPTSTTSSSSTPTLPSSSTPFLSATVTAAAEVKNPYSKKINKRYNKTNKSFLLVLFLSIITILLSSCFIVLLVHAYQLQSSSSLSSSSSNEDLSSSSSSILNANDNDGMKSTQQDSAGNDNSDTNNHSSQNISSNIRKNPKTSEESDTNNSNQNINNENPPIIAYAISLTSCSQTPSLVDGAAILAHSIHLNSIRNTNTHDKKPPSKYDYKLFAFFHTSVITETSTTSTTTTSSLSSSKEQYTQTDIQNNKCASILSKLGYEIKVVDIPVPLSEIQGEYLKTKLPSNGCCGEKEFIKLWSYTLVEHPFVVHLDLDTIVLKPMDELFDYALHGTVSSSLTTTTTIGSGNSGVVGDESEEERKKGVIMWKKEERNAMMNENWSNINAFFTRDYNMRPAGKKPVGVQGMCTASCV